MKTVVPPTQTQQDTGNMPASRVAATIATTQAAATKKRKMGPTMSMDTTSTCTNTEVVVGEEDDTRLPDAPAERVMKTPSKVVEEEGWSKPSAYGTSDAGSQMTARKASPRPIKVVWKLSGK